jgi:hypothetical protein
MEKLGRYILLCFVLALILFAWLERYQLVAANDEAIVYKLDRWTGKVYVCIVNDCFSATDD